MSARSVLSIVLLVLVGNMYNMQCHENIMYVFTAEEQPAGLHMCSTINLPTGPALYAWPRPPAVALH